MNRVAALELLPSAIADHVQPYVFRNELELQVVFYDYCLELMDTLVLTEDLEARLIMLIDRIDVPDMRVDLVLEFMQRIRIPWSGAVHDLIRRCFVYVSARRCSELATQFRLIRLKSARASYDLAGFEVSNLALIKGLLERITSRIDVIDALDDALLVS